MSGAVEGPDGVLGDGQGAEPLAGAFPRLRDRSPTSTCHTTAATLRGTNLESGVLLGFWGILVT